MNNPHNVHVGSEVRFLNAVGGGRIARITGDTAWVEDEDGFEIPTPLKDCVVVEKDDTFIPAIRPPKVIQDKLKSSSPGGELGRTQGNASHSTRKGIPVTSREVSSQPQERYPRNPKGGIPVTSEGSPAQTLGQSPHLPTKGLPYTYLPDHSELSVYLAFLPIDRTQLGLTSYEAYLVNKSNYCLFFTYLSSVGTSYKLRASGVIEPNGDAFLEEFTPASLNDLEQLALQLAPYDDQRPFKLLSPELVRLRLDARKFFKLHSFTENEFFQDDALLIPVLEGGRATEELIVETAKLEEALKIPSTKEKGQPHKKQPAPKRNPDEPLVIDLHAHSLLETTAGMSSADIHEYQIEYFHRIMQEELPHKGRKVIFIHGKGDGVLRSSIERELKHKYKSCTYQDASFREYGYGATQVTIR